MTKYPSDDEYDIYSLALLNVYQPKSNEMIVLCKETTSSRVLLAMDKEMCRELQVKCPNKWIASDFPGIAEETVERFIRINTLGGVLQARLRLDDVTQTVFSEAERRLIWGDSTLVKTDNVKTIDRGWRAFYEKFPNASGVFKFSRVGFDSKRTQAIVEIGVQSGPLVGQGKIMFFLKDTMGTWVLERQNLLWVS